MMRFGWVTVVAALVGCPAPGHEDSAEWTPPALTGGSEELPDAPAVVQRMADFMDGNTELAVEARVSYESVQASGQKLQFDMLQRIRLRKPDQLFWVTLRDDATVDSAWYDNGTFSMIRQPLDIWGQIRVPGAFAEAIGDLVADYGIDVPFPDILSGNPEDLWLGDDVTEIWYVGEAWVNGRWTDHVAIRKPGADIQLWIQQDEPYPAKLAIVFVDEPGQPAYTARFGRWSNTLPADPTLFEFTPPAEAQRIDVVPTIGS